MHAILIVSVKYMNINNVDVCFLTRMLIYLSKKSKEKLNLSVKNIRAITNVNSIVAFCDRY